MASSTVFSSFPRLFDNSEKPFQEFELALASHISLPGHAKGDLEAGLRTAFNITEDKDEGRAASCCEQEILTEFLVESRHQSSNQDAEQEMIKAEGRKETGKGAKAVFRICILIRISTIRMILGLPDPHPDPLVTSTDPFSLKSVERTIKIQKFSCKKLNFNHQTYFYNFEASKFH
jgi:hypothetical protein